ncbi:MAG: CRISPR system precrRNA processing endoribonuclease RAMP protein Cas6 [Deltaproteobacteria bacterium]|nr:CRISPR system precrRNA processing endoribonuclease RAMP protein Cas6 [Deltaproteobacteria bacterium]
MIPAKRYIFHLAASTPLLLPEYKGSTLRGGFGHAFKKVVCTFRGKPCDNCLLKHRCAYSYIFETPPPENSAKMVKYLRAPHPYIIEPPLEKRETYSAGETLKFGLVLIGRAMEYLPYFVYAFEELGMMGIGKRKGEFRLDRVCCGDDVVYEGATKVLNSLSCRDAEGTENNIEEGQRQIVLNFLTPTRLVLNEKLMAAPDFQTIFRTLLRRLSMLSYFHCGKELDLDYKGLIELAGSVVTTERNIHWWDWERYSSRQDERMKLGGFVGEMAFTGDLGKFIPFLRAGEMVHVGKGTGFGLGLYVMEENGCNQLATSLSSSG